MSTSGKPTITPTPDGPYLVKGLERLRGQKGPLPAKETMALCRCGGSASKPFCDGTHKKNGFRSARADDRVPDRCDDYRGAVITIHDNRGLCAHAGHCTDRLPAVFRMKKAPWIDPEGAPAQDIIDTIRACPSGALSYSLGGEPHRDRPGPPDIYVTPNGPYEVTGGPDLADAPRGDGASREHFTLCRCGGSKNKPFCDGSHWHNGFRAD